MMRLRLLVSVAGSLILASTSACFVVYGFDRFDDTAAGDAESAALALSVAATITVEPGTSRSLAVIVNKAGATLTAEVADPAAVGATVSGSEIVLSVPASVAPTTTTLHVSASLGAERASADVRVVIAGTPCDADRAFGDGGVAPVGVPGTPVTLVVGDAGITVAVGSNVARLTAEGAPMWARAVDGVPLALAVDASGRTVAFTTAGPQRLAADGTLDRSFAAERAAVADCAGATSTASGVLSVCGQDSDRWSLLALDDTGATVSTSIASFDDQSIARTASLAFHQGGYVACGRDARSRGYAALARWDESGLLDTTFGVGGRILLGDGSYADACVGQGSAIIVGGGWANEPAIFALDAKGRPAPSFADAGVFTLDPDTQAATVVDVVADRDALVALVNRAAQPYLMRLSANGVRDTAIGACELGALGLLRPARIAVTPEHRLVVLAVDADGAPRVGRLWL